MNIFRLLCAAIVLVGFSPAARAAELIMAEQAGCEWCETWDKEVGSVYHKTFEGKVAPLTRVNIHNKLPRRLAFINGLVYTPTFVLVDQDRELGRILGYPGEDFFWAMLQDLLDRLPANHEWHSRPRNEFDQAAQKASMTR